MELSDITTELGKTDLSSEILRGTSAFGKYVEGKIGDYALSSNVTAYETKMGKMVLVSLSSVMGENSGIPSGVFVLSALPKE